MPGRRAFLRRRHVTAGASRANRRRRTAVRGHGRSVALRSGSHVLGTAMPPRRFRCSDRRRSCAPDRLALGDLASSECRQRYLAEIAPERATLPPVPRSLSIAELLIPPTRKITMPARTAARTGLQITCHRRSENPSAVTAKTPKNGLEITNASLCQEAPPVLLEGYEVPFGRCRLTGDP